MSDQDRLNDYDSESVVYCARCYSLKIRHDEDIDSDYCMECGCTDMVESSIEEWEKKYEKRYGHKFAEKSNDLRKSPIFKMPLSKLMRKVSDSPKWETIIMNIFGAIPKGLSKADSIVVFFDKLERERKMDKLRELLYKMKI
jgi:hypothetical protein